MIFFVPLFDLFQRPVRAAIIWCGMMPYSIRHSFDNYGLVFFECEVSSGLCRLQNGQYVIPVDTDWSDSVASASSSYAIPFVLLGSWSGNRIAVVSTEVKKNQYNIRWRINPSPASKIPLPILIQYKSRILRSFILQNNFSLSTYCFQIKNNV